MNKTKKAIYKMLIGGIITYITMNIVSSMQIVTQYGNDLIFEYPIRAWLLLPVALYGMLLFSKGLNIIVIEYLE